MRNLTEEGKITIFKTLVISKIIHLSLVTNGPTEIIKELNKIQNKRIKEFLFGMETTQKLNPLPYVTNMKMIADIMWIFY